MNINDLFNSIKYGEDRYANMKSSSSNTKHIDEEYNFYKASSRIDELLPILGESSQIISNINKIKNKFKEYEDKVLSGTFTSSIYARMKMDSIVENYNDFAELLTENKKLIKEVDVDVLGRIMGSVKTGIKILSEKAEKEFVVSKFPIGVEKSLQEEVNVLEELLKE
jgi:hypothetical protein